ncbi:MAG: hypothetical protein [Bacteriophage sp.]|nr:MAG: hypothetical protein [Bacteriophage sp.]
MNKVKFECVDNNWKSFDEQGDYLSTYRLYYPAEVSHLIESIIMDDDTCYWDEDCREFIFYEGYVIVTTDFGENVDDSEIREIENCFEHAQYYKELNGITIKFEITTP